MAWTILEVSRWWVPKWLLRAAIGHAWLTHAPLKRVLFRKARLWSEDHDGPAYRVVGGVTEAQAAKNLVLRRPESGCAVRA